MSFLTPVYVFVLSSQLCVALPLIPNFLIHVFTGILSSAQASLDDAVTLKECDSIDLTRISSPNDYIAAASSTETLEQIEEVVTAWIKQIEQVISNYMDTVDGYLC